MSTNLEDTIVDFICDDFHAQISLDSKADYILWWSDYVANEWTETYTLPGPAFARLALLCETSQEKQLFAASDSEVFEEVWDEFVVRNLA